LPKAAHVTITVYDILGNVLKRLVNEFESPGQRSVDFAANNFSSGIFLYAIKAGEYSDVKKMILLK
jgi:hypothetical protein